MGVINAERVHIINRVGEIGGFICTQTEEGSVWERRPLGLGTNEVRSGT